MSADEEALFQGIIDNPAEDGPRLVYADFLEERGESRLAAFIRLQCELERTEDGPRRADLLRLLGERMGSDPPWEWDPRLRRLLREDLPGRPASERRWGILNWAYGRGFVEELTVRCQTLLDHADLISATGPIRHLNVRSARDRCAGLARCAFLARLKLLNLGSNGLRARDIRLLVRSSYLSGLETLNLSWNRIGDVGVAVLVEWGPFGNLRLLDLRGNPLGPDMLEALRARFGKRVLA